MLKDAFQPSLFDRSEPVGPRRVALDADSWIEWVPGWLEQPGELFAWLRDHAPWQQRERTMWEQRVVEPRLTAELAELAAAPAALRRAAERLSTQYGVSYDSLWLNFYRDGRDSTAWHGDRISRRHRAHTVPVLTLGATRRFLIKRRKGGPSLALWPAAGDLVAMGGLCQRDFQHCVPKAPGSVGPRISVNFQSSERRGAPPRRSP
jgi:alkylated DNA repair dioxygenase AlkB